MTLLSIKNLVACHGHLSAVRGVDLDVKQGEIIALIGANGAGKTTFLRTIAGAHRAASGSISFNGAPVTNLASHERVALGLALVPEGRKLFGEMTVEENLLLGRSVGRSGPWTPQRVMEVFPNLVKRRHFKTSTLSGGEQQATAIGRALVSNPELLILDEISLGLSPLVVDQVYGSLEKLLKSGTTIILVEQDLSRAMKVASRAICMLEGAIALDRPMGDLSRDEVTDAYFGLQKLENVTEPNA